MAQTTALVISLLTLLMPLMSVAATAYRPDRTLSDYDDFWSEEMEEASAVERPQRDASSDTFAFGSIFETLLDILSTLRDATVGRVGVFTRGAYGPSPVADADAEAVPDAAPEVNSIFAPATNIAREILAPASNVANEILAPASNVANEIIAPVSHVANEIIAPASNFAKEFIAPVSNMAAAAADKTELYREQQSKRVKKQYTVPDSTVFNDVRSVGDHIKFDSRDNSITF